MGLSHEGLLRHQASGVSHVSLQNWLWVFLKKEPEWKGNIQDKSDLEVKKQMMAFTHPAYI